MRVKDELRDPHKVTAAELDLLRRLLPETHPLRSALLTQAASASIRWLDARGQPAILFAVPEHLPPVATSGVVAEGSAPDKDQVPVHFLLHLSGGRLAEIEVYREDGDAVIELPPPTALDVL